MAIFFTSDTHFGDWRRLTIDKRPFASIAAHDAALVTQWNEAVGPDDDVWHLGDFALGLKPERIRDILDSLNGSKHLIIGNNDGPATIEAAGWADTGHYAEIEVDGRLVILCHYPLRTWNKMGRGAIDLHGHSHGRLKPLTRQYDVGVDVWDYRPVSLEHILARRPGRRAGEG
ncbi:MAG: metallophosphoesterase family protein [Hyphomicrobiales bacterium]